MLAGKLSEQLSRERLGSHCTFSTVIRSQMSAILLRTVVRADVVAQVRTNIEGEDGGREA